MRRRGWKRGDWKVLDEESGFVTYGSRVAYDYYGVLKLKSQGDKAHPQDFIRAKNDPTPVWPTNSPEIEYDLDNAVVGFTVGNTAVDTAYGPALHLFRPGVDFAKIEYDLFVF